MLLVHVVCPGFLLEFREVRDRFTFLLHVSSRLLPTTVFQVSWSSMAMETVGLA